MFICAVVGLRVDHVCQGNVALRGHQAQQETTRAARRLCSRDICIGCLLGRISIAPTPPELTPFSSSIRQCRPFALPSPMSGFEVVGVVLGSLPLVISALEHYRDGLRAMQRWRKYERELQSLVRNLETERAKLQNVCEKLLVGLVPPSRIEAMVNDPTGPLWLETETQKKIRARLWRSWPVFQDRTRSMQLAIEELMGKLKRPAGSDVKVSRQDSQFNPTTLTRLLPRISSPGPIPPPPLPRDSSGPPSHLTGRSTPSYCQPLGMGSQASSR